MMPKMLYWLANVKLEYTILIQNPVIWTWEGGGAPALTQIMGTHPPASHGKKSGKILILNKGFIEIFPRKICKTKTEPEVLNF